MANPFESFKELFHALSSSDPQSNAKQNSAAKEHVPKALKPSQAADQHTSKPKIPQSQNADQSSGAGLNSASNPTLSTPADEPRFIELFGAAVQPHTHSKVLPLSASQKLKQLKQQTQHVLPALAEPAEVEAYLLRSFDSDGLGTQAHNYQRSEQVLEYRSTHTPKRLLESLKKGKLSCAMEVDLHGASLDNALLTCSELIAEAREHSVRVVRVVHGKGLHGTLKHELAQAFAKHPFVLAYASAPQSMGGSGALLVLLKRKA